MSSLGGLVLVLLLVGGSSGDCGPGTELLTCLKARLAGVLERAVRARRDIELLPGLTLVAEEENEALENKELLPRAANEADPKEVDGTVIHNLAAFFRTHSLQLRLSQLPGIEEGRGKKRRGAHNLLMMMFMMASMMLPLKMGTLAMLAGKALIISKLALALAAIVGLKKLLGNDEHQDSYQEAVRRVQPSPLLWRAASSEVSVPDYKPNPNETTQVKRARLLYQSRKRGMLENDLLLSTFVDKYLEEMDGEMLAEYDGLINSQYSDWDIYYWVVGSRPTPPEYDNRVMALLKDHVQNRGKESRLRQPDLPTRRLQQ